jgi:AraC-like DNA-binding protein
MPIIDGDDFPMLRLERWLALLADPRTTVRIQHAFHDVQGPPWGQRGTRVPEHINWFVLSNGVRLRLGGRSLRVEPGSWLCLVPGAPLHAELIQPERRIGFLRFRLVVERDGAELPIPGGGFVLPGARSLLPLAERLVRPPGADAFAAHRQRGLVVALFAEAFRMLERSRTRHARALDEAQLRRLGAFVANQLPRPVVPAQLAGLLRLRPDTFARAFHRACGRSPRAWIADRRIRHAAELLLAPGATATAVAARCGYGDVFAFCKRFRRQIGCGTRAWRRNHGLLA